MSIFLEAIQRFAEPQEVSNPILILIVGCTGLASNFPGMVFLHEHEEPEPGANNIANTLFDQDEIDVHSVPQQARGLRRATTLSQISVQPTALRADIIAAGQPHAVPGSSEQQDENTELRTGQSPELHLKARPKLRICTRDHIHPRQDRNKGKGKGHDLNMTGVFLETLSAISASSLRPCISG